jgi:hypothetical protein
MAAGGKRENRKPFRVQHDAAISLAHACRTYEAGFERVRSRGSVSVKAKPSAD